MAYLKIVHNRKRRQFYPSKPRRLTRLNQQAMQERVDEDAHYKQLAEEFYAQYGRGTLCHF